MAKRYTWGHAFTAIGLVGALTACSNSLSGTRSASIKLDESKVGLAMRAQAALTANDLPLALSLGEAAVEHRPNDANFRAMLGNIYLSAGRYASAERSYHDALTLAAPDPQVVLKYALVQIAQGKTDDAVTMLGEASSLLDPADLGLALALAGRADDAVALLEPAARLRGADARTRQNLALAHALNGDWETARIVAAQDLAADQVELRMAEWLAFARPGQASAQVASFIGIQPVANDPGQPTRLALARPSDAVRQAAAQLPAPVAMAAPVEPVQPAPEVAAVAAPSEPVPLAQMVVEALAPIVDALSPDPVAPPMPVMSAAAANPKPSLPALRRDAALRTGAANSRVVVQLGAYDKRDYIAGAWNKVSGRHAALRDYTPVTARFVGPKGTFYRLSVKGFATNREANELCGSLKRAGANCFVRQAFNDAPIRLASR